MRTVAGGAQTRPATPVDRRHTPLASGPLTHTPTWRTAGAHRHPADR
jgi:hypothetical protein